MSDVRVTNTPGTRPRAFSIDAYAARSFGVFQEEPHDVVLRFVPEVADEVASFQFHPGQGASRKPPASRPCISAPAACGKWRGIYLRGEQR
jgi:hypothetical protein